MESQEWEADCVELIHEIRKFYFHLDVLQRSSLSLYMSGIGSASYGSYGCQWCSVQ